jgi:outer membrane protein OmpA-like peptidoglycan-associated protein/Tol biopolymer transport system component
MKTAHTLIAALLLLQAMGQEYHVVEPLQIRPGGEDYAPVPVEGGFVMASAREGLSVIEYRDAETGAYMSNLYFVPFDGSKAGNPRLFSEALHTRVNEGPATFSPDGHTICYTRNIDPKGGRGAARKAMGQLGLFFSELLDGNWSEPLPFAHNADRYALMHPAFSPSGDTLVFSSDMPGGRGGFDLYYSTRTTDGWSAPVNLGPSINGPAHEVYPRWQNTGELHFASDRPGGHGGLDILVTRRAGSKWATPEHLPEPVNSAANDHGFARIPGSRRALFTSNRSGTDAIHLAYTAIPTFAGCNAQSEDQLCFVFRKPEHPITNKLPLDHVWDMGDGVQYTGFEARHCYNHGGSFLVRSMLVDRASGDVFHVLQERTLDVRTTPQAYISAPDTVPPGTIVVLEGLSTHLPGITAEAQHWDLGDGRSATGAKVMHQFRTTGTYTVRLDIHGAPSTAQPLRNHCVEKTVVVSEDAGRRYAGMTIISRDDQGSTRSFKYQEIPHDLFAISAEEQEEVRFSVTLFASRERMDLNDPVFMEVRRTYRVVEHYDPVKAVYVYTVGDTDDLEEVYAIFQHLRELDFLEADVFVMQEDKLVDMSMLDLTSRRDLDRAIVSTQAIHFAYNSAQIEEAGRKVLDPLVKALAKHPDMHLVVEAHTDDIGGEAYNMDLSQARAMAVAKELVERGVDEERLTPIGHGKNKTLASNHTEAGRQANRRVEFRMVMTDELQATGGVH